MLGRTLRFALVLLTALSLVVLVLPVASSAAPPAKEPTVSAQVQVSRNCAVKVVAKWSNSDGVTAVGAIAHVGTAGSGYVFLDESVSTTANRGREVFTAQLAPSGVQTGLFARTYVDTASGRTWSGLVEKTVSCTLAS